MHCWRYSMNICCKSHHLLKEKHNLSRKLSFACERKWLFYSGNCTKQHASKLLDHHMLLRKLLRSSLSCPDSACFFSNSCSALVLRKHSNLKFMRGTHPPNLSTICDRLSKFSSSNCLYMKFLDSLQDEYERRSNKKESVGYQSAQSSGRSLYELSTIVSAVHELKKTLTEVEELKALITDLSPEDDSLMSIADQDILQCEEKIRKIEIELIDLLIPEEKVDNNDIIFEVTAGVGGQEAMLFAEEIFHMYQNYSAYKGWNLNVISYDKAEGVGGVRQASAEISGRNVYKYLKFEAGVHRVQRVPKTERSGRLHTSTITVSVLPQPTEIDVQLNPKDLNIDVFRSTGAGGQSVNKTNSAVRITHKPTGMVAECQTDRSQIRNKATAMNVLRTRIYQKEFDKQVASRKARRKLQIGTAGRSEKNRTYNYSQDRITEHRIGETTYNLQIFLKGGEELDNLIEKLLEEERIESLDIILDEFEATLKQQVIS